MNISKGYCAGLDLEMYLYRKENKTVTGSLGQNDQIVHVARQRRLSGAVISPAVVVLTSKSVIIVNRLLGGIRSDITFISHQDIASLRIAHGVIFSSVFVRIRGAAGGLGKVFKGETEEGEVNGLCREDADMIFRKLNDMRKGSGQRHMQNFFVYGQVVNHYHSDSAAGGWAWAADPENGEQLYAPFRLMQDGRQGTRPETQSADAWEAKPLIAHRVSMVAGSGTVRHTIRADDLLIFKMRREHADRYSVMP